MRPVNDEEVLRALETHTNGYGNRAKFADKLDMEPAYLGQILAGTRPICAKLTDALGYELRWVKK